MNTILTPITGTETNISNKEQKALTEFYAAFNGRNFELMEKNWLNSNEIAMDNPLGGIKRGWDEIHTIYQRIFSAKVKVYVEFYDYTIIKLNGSFCAVGRERGLVEVDNISLNLAIRTSRIYKLINDEYKQVHHHGSIENPKLLQQYQNLLK